MTKKKTKKKPKLAPRSLHFTFMGNPKDKPNEEQVLIEQGEGLVVEDLLYLFSLLADGLLTGFGKDKSTEYLSKLTLGELAKWVTRKPQAKVCQEK